jgi:predicted glycogen debranching enzyme
MLPNRFPDSGAPEYNSVDASLWFVIAVHDYLATGHAQKETQDRLQQAVDAILDGYARGTRFQIAAASEDGLLRAGVPGVQLTWMDAKVGDWVVTPRIGKPVEVQALWINALRIAAAWSPRWTEPAARATHAFQQRFTDPASGALYDVVDADHEPGKIDCSIRPNQLFAVGGLPFALIDNDASARAIVDQCEQLLLTPLGMRTLSPNDPAYQGRYIGTPLQRDGAYHQGTVWPWLLGPFVEAWLRVHDDQSSKAQARERFLTPLHEHLHRAGLDHISEVADGDAPHTPGGTPFQAWSLGELMRLERLLDAD